MDPCCTYAAVVPVVLSHPVGVVLWTWHGKQLATVNTALPLSAATAHYSAVEFCSSGTVEVYPQTCGGAEDLGAAACSGRENVDGGATTCELCCCCCCVLARRRSLRRRFSIHTVYTCVS